MMSTLAAFKPQPDSDTPLYLQLANMLSDGIAGGEWRANQALPSDLHFLHKCPGALI